MMWLTLSSPVSLATVLSVASLASATQYDVKVGAGGQLKFDPETLTAQVGDKITYHFFPKNHSVIQSTFAEPCKPQAGGFFSAFTPNASPDANVESATTFTITVNDTKPIWVYCGQTKGDHCQSGMVHSINAPCEGNTFDKFKSSATSAQKPSGSPPDGLPVGGVRKLHIDVGFNGNLVFNPANVTEIPGTLVEFGFNPANHSVVQSSFEDPCHPLKNGFSAPFVPTQLSSSGVTFDIELKDDKPLWFYCAQTAKTHCQAGMVGSINAALTGDKTFDAYKALAAKASPSTIQPQQPNVGTLKVNGTEISYITGVVLDTSSKTDDYHYIPPPGYAYPPDIVGIAGGSPPANYSWAPSISDEAVTFLQILQYIENFFLAVQFHGYEQLNQGFWKGVYPESITNTIGSMSMQSLIQRSTYTDSLQHYSKPLAGNCTYNLHSDSVKEWLQTSLTALTLSIGVIIDVLSLVAGQDRWMMAALATQLGSKARMSGVINMMQNHLAAAAPREVLIPHQLAYSYVRSKYVQDGSCGDDNEFGTVYPMLNITNKMSAPGTGRITQITVGVPSSEAKWMAWIGPWGNLKYSDVGTDGTTYVPKDLSGHVWAVLTKERGMKSHEIANVTVAGPEMIWVTNPWA